MSLIYGIRDTRLRILAFNYIQKDYNRNNEFASPCSGLNAERKYKSPEQRRNVCISGDRDC